MFLSEFGLGVSAYGLTLNSFQNQAFFSQDKINLTLYLTVKHSWVLPFFAALMNFCLTDSGQILFSLF